MHYIQSCFVLFLQENLPLDAIFVSAEFVRSYQTAAPLDADRDGKLRKACAIRRPFVQRLSFDLISYSPRSSLHGQIAKRKSSVFCTECMWCSVLQSLGFWICYTLKSYMKEYRVRLVSFLSNCCIGSNLMLYRAPTSPRKSLQWTRVPVTRW